MTTPVSSGDYEPPAGFSQNNAESNNSGFWGDVYDNFGDRVDEDAWAAIGSWVGGGLGGFIGAVTTRSLKGVTVGATGGSYLGEKLGQAISDTIEERQDGTSKTISSGSRDFTFEFVGVQDDGDGWLYTTRVGFSTMTAAVSSSGKVTGLDILGDAKGNYLEGGFEDNFINGKFGDDILIGKGGRDRLHGLDGNDGLFGNTGNDDLYGENGADRLSAGMGDDILYGGTGRDVLIAGWGHDEMDGGMGADTFVFAEGDEFDVASDFNNAEGDRVDGFGRVAYWTSLPSGDDFSVRDGRHHWITFDEDRPPDAALGSLDAVNAWVHNLIA